MTIDIDKTKCNEDGERYVRFRCGDYAQKIEAFVNTDEWEIIEVFPIPFPNFAEGRDEGRLLEIHAKVRLREILL